MGVEVAMAENNTGIERDWRIPFRAKVVMVNPKTGESMDGEVRDLSMGGMFVKTLLPFKPGTELKVEIQMKPINYRGNVRVQRPRDAAEEEDQSYGMAVVWIDRTPNQKRLLSLLINDHVRGGGRLLEGNPYRDAEYFRAGGKPVARPAANHDRVLLIGGLSAVALVVVVALLILL